MFLLHNDLSSVISIHHQRRFVCMILCIGCSLWTGHYFNCFFTVLFANQIMICSTLTGHVPLVLSCLFNSSGLATDFEQDIVAVISFLVICFLPCLLIKYWFVSCFFFSISVFFHNHSRITGLQGKVEDISLTPHYQFHPLHRNLDISWAITAESSPLHTGSSRTGTGNLWFPSGNR